MSDWGRGMACLLVLAALFSLAYVLGQLAVYGTMRIW